MAGLGISDVGFFAVLIALALAPYGVAAAAVGYHRRLPELVVSSRRAVYAIAVLLTVAILLLLRAFIVHDFSLRYVAEQSSRDLPLAFTVAALYSGQAGSLLFWSWMLSLFSAAAVATGHRHHRQLVPYAGATLLVIQGFFLVVLGFVTNPFERLTFPIADGRGLNPLLIDGGILVHPPFLLTGYMSATIPFAFAIAALLSGRLDNDWIAAVRKWAVLSWAILGAGLLLGAWWAYHVLGWGGYWGWDPVENAALMPWLASTAFIHSIMVQERRAMLKAWNFTLIILTFNLSIFGTFLTRSGLISSVHAFAESEIGPYFLGFLAATLVGSLGLLFYRLSQLGGAGRFQSFLSREASFLLNNLLLVGAAFAVFWGSIFPLVTEAVQGNKITVGPPFFNQVNAPIFFALLLLMGIGPLLGWRRTPTEGLLRSLRWPTVAALAAGVAAFVLGPRQLLPAIGLAGCGFVAGTIAVEYWHGVASRRGSTGESVPAALLALVARSRRRYGGYLVHLGLVLFAVGVIGSSFYKIEREQRLTPGESTTIGRYTLLYLGTSESQEPLARVSSAWFTLAAPGSRPVELAAEKRFYRGWERQPTTGVVIQTQLPSLDDVYVFLAALDPDGTATFHLYVNPLVALLWAGGLVLLAGMVVALWPEAQVEPRPAAERAGAKVVASEA